ncbi:GGDEF domain-containing protein [Brevibacillus sp. SYSU BS000544]|uniref:GGDEF domain-containing protein n=1 Tax=Brevibacillus sp. SYSU BS000544 TaxID=3416443 RepID=UPI003CE47D23
MLRSLFHLFNKTPIVLSEKKYRLQTVISQTFATGSTVVLFYVDIVKLTDIEHRYGDMVTKRIIQRFERIVMSAAKRIFGIKGKLLGIQKLFGDDFAIYASFPRGSIEEDFRMLSISFQQLVESLLSEQVEFVNREHIKVHIGYAELPGNDIVKEMYTCVKHAVHMAKYGLTSEKYNLVTQFHRLLQEEAVHMLYMPIVSLRDGEPLGWEALARGPENSHFFSPATLFSYADETDNVFRLESICRRRALEKLRYVGKNEKIFINLDPRAIDDPYLLRGTLFKELEALQLHPSNIVLEITERHAITNYRVFRKIIEEYRKKGYLIAVDDAGAGYSSLESIAEIYPDFIKLDMSLIRNIDIDTIKQALLETFVQFAEKVKCKIIAEGIETEGELQTLIELGVPYGQGFYLGKPAKGLTQIPGNAMNFIRETQEKRKENQSYRVDTSDIGDIVTKTIFVDRDTKVRKIHQIFEQNRRIDSIVILDQQTPVGLIMRFQLYQVLGGQYGISLYYERSVSHIMNVNPLIVNKKDKIEDVARRAMARDAFHLYDVIIIVDADNHYVGIVTVQSLLDKMTTIKLELATFANPLTGLPGNLRIERELFKRLQTQHEFMVIYCDLDRFKWFNDQYGFEIGDKIIQHTAQLLRESVVHNGNSNDFVGHIGGDDFIIVTNVYAAKEIAAYIITSFPTYFKDIETKYRKTLDEPQLSISLAGLICSKQRYQSVIEISEQAAKLKRRAKQQPGNVYVTDHDESPRLIALD